jgi:hypothetical protein
MTEDEMGGTRSMNEIRNACNISRTTATWGTWAHVGVNIKMELCAGVDWTQLAQDTVESRGRLLWARWWTEGKLTIRLCFLQFDRVPGLDDRAIRVRSPAGAKDFSSILCVQTGSGAHPASCTMGTGGPIPGGKGRPGRDADHSPSSSAEVENE